MLENNEDDKIKEQLDNYMINNYQLLEDAYSHYINLTNEMKLDSYWVWGKDQLAAVMLLAEQKYAHLIEILELELEKNNLDPFATPKASSYLIAKNENGTIVMIYIRKNNIREFTFQLVPIDILKIFEQNNSLDNKKNDFTGEGYDLFNEEGE